MCRIVIHLLLVIVGVQFVQYEKMIYLDGDIQVYDNINHLFELPDGQFYAVMNCFCEKTWSHTPQYKIGYCQQCPDKVASLKELDLSPSLYFDAGMFVFEPSLDTCKDFLRTVQITPSTPFAEQNFLNMYFGNIYKPIPLTYNLVLEKVKVVHYCAAGLKLHGEGRERAEREHQGVCAEVMGHIQ